MDHRRAITRTQAPLAALAALVVAGCAGPVARASAPASRPAACRPAAKSVLPHTTGTITQNDDKARICVAVGQAVAVLLGADTSDHGGLWQAVEAQPRTGVRPMGSGMTTLSANTTGGLLVPTAPGETTLTSHRTSGQTWQVTLVAS